MYPMKVTNFLPICILVWATVPYLDYVSQYAVAEDTPKKDQRRICRGSSFGLTFSYDYELYRSKYTNCTYVDGNLELVSLDRNNDMSFLEDIKEVTGYVLISSVMSEYVGLRNLRIIRGQTLFQYDGQRYSLFVASNHRLKELQFASLHEILDGDIYFNDNSQLCHENTIEWHDILQGTVLMNSSVTSRTCPSCDASCTSGRCWGSGQNMCQKLTWLSCSTGCVEVRCYGTQVTACCHKECIGGCVGPTNRDCLGCKHYDNDGRCEPYCPREFYGNPQVRNPDFKYTHGSICLDKCPSYLIADKGACVRECDDGFVDENGKCVECKECPKRCNGTKSPDFVHSGNIAQFAGCAIVRGSISITQTTFSGDAERGIMGISEDQLSVFSTVKEIAGYFQIEASSVTTLDFFSNLQKIRGNDQIQGTGLSLMISGTSLESCNLQSLKEVQYGDVLISNNSRLCHIDSVDWRNLVTPSEQQIFVVANRNPALCVEENRTCSVECSSEGCWGPLEDQCLSCANFHLDRSCLRSCDAISNIYRESPDSTACQRCHPECRTKCTDDSPSSCDDCKNVKDGTDCVPECPPSKYPDDENVCQSCHKNCESGCTGGQNSFGSGACNSCAVVVLDSGENVTSCLPADANCEDGYYKKMLQGNRHEQLNGKQACKRCHPECLRCNEYSLSLSSCQVCLHFQQEDRCVQNCSSDFYLQNRTNPVCLRCDSRCLHCTGPTASECTVCKHYLVYNNLDDRTKGFNCTETCPDHVPHKSIEETEDGEKVTVCVTEDNKLDPKKIGIIVGSVIGGVILLCVIIVAIVVAMYRRARAEANKVKLTAQLYGLTELEPLSPTGVSPDMSSLRLIKESELRRGGLIGTGAFGEVYKGLWSPENENVKLVVAIKVVNEGASPSQNSKLLEEVRIMASVNDPYCIRIIAFCMTERMMIITQLMPIGNLLDFVRKNKENIGSKVFLNWCTQIAKGMAHLEENSIVHRDLAARNILVQHPEHVRITDFGLAKLLEERDYVSQSYNEKLPIKWLALESIQHHLFTHKSDVWSYGVTLWELFTYGDKPYDNVDSSAIENLLEKGERLAQPPMCTIDVYMIMIKCWVIDSTCRPHFRLLTEEFAKMARDPGRYLVIQGDELMRLPNQVHDMKELIRCMSINSEGMDQVVTVDDYLRPRGRMRSSTSRPSSDRLESVDETEIDERSPGGPNYTAAAGGHRLRRSSRNRDPACAVQRQQSSSSSSAAAGQTPQKNSRYCSDPCKGAIEEIVHFEQASSPPAGGASSGRLSRDEDRRGNGEGEGEGEGGRRPGSSSNDLRGRSRVSGEPFVDVRSSPSSPLYPKDALRQSTADEDYLLPQDTNGSAKKYSGINEDDRNNYAGASPLTSFISNPEYFEDIPSSEKEGVQPLLFENAHRRSGSQDSTNYYNDLPPEVFSKTFQKPATSGL